MYSNNYLNQIAVSYVIFKNSTLFLPNCMERKIFVYSTSWNIDVILEKDWVRKQGENWCSWNSTTSQAMRLVWWQLRFRGKILVNMHKSWDMSHTHITVKCFSSTRETEKLHVLCYRESWSRFCPVYFPQDQPTQHPWQPWFRKIFGTINGNANLIRLFKMSYI